MKMGRRTLFYENRSFPDLSKPLPINENNLYPNAMREIGKAMLIIREHAVEWLVDSDRIAVCGFSAGGHNECWKGD